VINRRRFVQAAGAAGVAAFSLGDGLAFSTLPAAYAAEPAVVEPPLGIPFLHGYDAPAIKSWTSASDPYAKYLRSRVPVATRIPAFQPTQARPGLAGGPRMMSLANDYMEADNFVLAHKYGNAFQAYALRFWQYLDLMGSWHGLPVYGDHDAEEPRFGMINLPNPAWSDAAHRNGALSLGCWYWPRSEDFAQVLEQRADGSFPMADQLVSIARYFGFDGYFINQEAQITPEQAVLLHDFFAYLASISHESPERSDKSALHVQWYDSLTTAGTVRYQNEFNTVNSPWVLSDGERICDSIFLNYWWNDARMQRSHDYAVSLGLDPYEVVYSGTEGGLNNFSQPYDPRFVFPEGSPARTSWAILGSEFVWRIVPGDKATVEEQAAAYTYERQWWSGPAQDPSRTGRSLPPTGSDKLNPERWDGVAHYIVEKSVVGGYPFVTRFNPGTGLGCFVDGRAVSERPWFNIGTQDVLPTWQWWKSAGLDVDYDYANAWNGPASLRLSGALQAGVPLEAKLYKTKLEVSRSVTLAIRYRTGVAHAASNLRIGLVFEDAPDQTVWLAAGRARSAGWNEQRWPLGRYAGRTIATISAGLSSSEAVAGHTVWLGELALSREADCRLPRRPKGFRVEQAHFGDGTATAYLAWELEPRDVWYYDLFRVWDGGREWLGRTYDEVFVVPGLTRQGTEPVTRLELVAVSTAGAPSPGARAAVRWS
jgi:endo-beta-N-acetylglucosaminidase D